MDSRMRETLRVVQGLISRVQGLIWTRSGLHQRDPFQKNYFQNYFRGVTSHLYLTSGGAA